MGPQQDAHALTVKVFIWVLWITNVVFAFAHTYVICVPYFVTTKLCGVSVTLLAIYPPIPWTVSPFCVVIGCHTLQVLIIAKVITRSGLTKPDITLS